MVVHVGRDEVSYLIVMEWRESQSGDYESNN